MDYDDHDLCSLEAQDILGRASEYLLQLTISGQIDLNELARRELRARLRHEATKQIAAMARSQP